MALYAFWCLFIFIQLSSVSMLGITKTIIILVLLWVTFAVQYDLQYIFIVFYIIIFFLKCTSCMLTRFLGYCKTYLNDMFLLLSWIFTSFFETQLCLIFVLVQRYPSLMLVSPSNTLQLVSACISNERIRSSMCWSFILSIPFLILSK